MKRKPVTLVVGVAAIAGLTGAYFGLKNYNEKAEEAALEEASGEEILNVDTGSLSKVSFYINGQEETFSLEDDQWKLESDETFPVDGTQVLSPVSQLAPLQAVRILENAEDISEYGLEEPQNVITLTDSDGEVMTLAIGDTNSGTGNDYLMLNGDETIIYTIEDSLRTSISDDLYDYAYSDEMPKLLVSEMTGVTLKTGTDGYCLYLEDAQWMVGTPVSKNEAATETSSEETEDQKDADLSAASAENGTEADADVVNDAMSSLGSLAYADFLEHNCTDDEVYGFDETDTVLTIYYQVEESEEDAEETSEQVEDDSEDAEESSEQTEEPEDTEEAFEQEETETPKEERSVSFRIGTTDSLGNYYVQMIGSAEVHTLSSTVLADFLGKTAEDWELQEAETEAETEAATVTETEVETEAAAEIETEE